jgi:hypothetical protein
VRFNTHAINTTIAMTTAQLPGKTENATAHARPTISEIPARNMSDVITKRIAMATARLQAPREVASATVMIPAMKYGKENSARLVLSGKQRERHHLFLTTYQHRCNRCTSWPGSGLMMVSTGTTLQQTLLGR